MKSEIMNRVTFAECLTIGQTVYEWAPHSAATLEITNLGKVILEND